MTNFRILPILLLAIFATCARAEPVFDPRDSLSPKTDRNDALALPLQTVTLSTVSLEQTRLFYVDGMGMTLTGPAQVSPALKAQQRSLWAIPQGVDWQEYHLTRPEAETEQGRPAMSIRVLLLDQPQPAIHASWDPRSLGGFSMGFPNTKQIEVDAKVRDLGFGALNEIEIYDVPRTDGSMYAIEETIFNAPDFVHAVGINRLGMTPLGAVTGESGLGGPGYSAQAIDNGDLVLSFYTEVLGLEMRRDSVWQSAGQDGAMSLPNGTEFRFSLLFAKGFGPGGHLLFVDYLNIDHIEPNAPPRVPNLGIGMWSFPVTDLAAVLSNAESFGSDIVHAATQIDDPLHGQITAATLLAPNGFLIEVYEMETER